MTEPILLTTILFLLGLQIGSFASVVIGSFRNNSTDYIFRRSKCTHTGTQLKWYELLPVISYLIQKGKSRYTNKPIGAHYLYAELMCGFLFTLPYVYSLYTPLSFAQIILLYGVLFSGFLIAYYDALYQEIPDAFTFCFALTGFFLANSSGISLNQQILAASIGSSFFLAQYIVSRGAWIGSGDILLGAAMGLVLGWEKVLLALVLSYFFGSIVAIWLLLSKRKNNKKSTHIAFGPFLVIGTIITYFYGDFIIEFYKQTILY